jgi:thiamine pyrophosphokinase
MTTAVVIGGMAQHQAMPPPRAMQSIGTVIAADSGYDLAVALGLRVDTLVGDLDSISAQGLAGAEASSVEIVRHPSDKDATDFELALAMARERDDSPVVVIGGEGGRFDHVLGNVSTLASPRVGAGAEAWFGGAYVAVVRSHWAATMVDGACLSVIPWGGAATVTETGVRWPLHAEELPLGSSRGMSNEAVGDRVEVHVSDGVVLVVVPEAGDLS